MSEPTENILTELGELQAQRLELGLGLGPQSVRPCRPEARNRRAHRRVVLGGVLVHVASIGNLAPGSRVDAVDLGARERLETVHTILLGECVYAGVLEQLVAHVIDTRGSRIGLEVARAGYLLGEVFARVQEFEEAADSLNVLIRKLDLTGLLRVNPSDLHS